MRAIKTKYFGPTNFKGARLRASISGVGAMYVPWDHSLNADRNHQAAALEVVKKIGKGWVDAVKRYKLVSGSVENGEQVHVYMIDWFDFETAYPNLEVGA